MNDEVNLYKSWPVGIHVLQYLPKNKVCNVVFDIVGKSIEWNTDRKYTPKNRAIFSQFCVKIALTTNKTVKKSVFGHPKSFQGVYLSIKYANFQSKMQKSPRLQWQIISTKNANN